jgi:hypothetical protein
MRRALFATMSIVCLVAIMTSASPGRSRTRPGPSNATGSVLPPGRNLGLPWQLSVLNLRAMYGDRLRYSGLL